MGKASKATAPDKQSIEGYEGAFAEIDDYTIAFEEYSADADLAPLFVGLPDDRCQAPHWGYVIRGKLAYKHGRRHGRGDRRGRGLLRRPRPHPAPLRGHRGRRVQPDRRARQDHGGRAAELRRRRLIAGYACDRRRRSERRRAGTGD